MWKATGEDFLYVFQEEVLLEVAESLNPKLESTSYRIHLYLAPGEEDRVRALARSCYAGNSGLSDSFAEWFTLAYIAGIALHCREVQHRTLVRTPLGYEEWRRLIESYPTEFLRSRIWERRSAYQAARQTNAVLAAQLLETPITVQEPLAENRDVEGLIRKCDLMKYLCPVLKSATDDAFEIAKAITPVLLSLTLAGVIVLPLAPALIATIAIVVSKMTIAALCVGYPVEKKP